MTLRERPALQRGKRERKKADSKNADSRSEVRLFGCSTAYLTLLSLATCSIWQNGVIVCPHEKHPVAYDGCGYHNCCDKQPTNSPRPDGTFVSTVSYTYSPPTFKEVRYRSIQEDCRNTTWRQDISCI